MDMSNNHLKSLLDQTDIAFKKLLRNPDSFELNEKYEHAKRELNLYVGTVRKQLNAS